MNYIYDIFLNLNDTYYDFYEWNKRDNIIHIKKIPIIKIKTNILIDIIKNKVKLNQEFINKYREKAEIFQNKLKYNYLLISDSKMVIGIEFNTNGLITRKSSLLIDDENDILEILFSIPETSLSTKIVKEENIMYNTRKEIDNKKYIIKSLKKIDQEKLKYLYFECFNQKEDNPNIVLKNILIEVMRNNERIQNIVYNFLKLVSMPY